MISTKQWGAISLLSAVGVMLASYLLYQYIYRPPFQPCTINAWINCDAVIKGAVSTTFGIPTALIGLVGYVAIFFSSILRSKNLLFGLTMFGILFCLRLLFIELFIIKVICIICLMCFAVMTTLFLLSLKYKFRN